MARILKMKKKIIDSMEDYDWCLICPECDNDTFEIRLNEDPQKTDDWEVSYIICSKCGA